MSLFIASLQFSMLLRVIQDKLVQGILLISLINKSVIRLNPFKSVSIKMELQIYKGYSHLIIREGRLVYFPIIDIPQNTELKSYLLVLSNYMKRKAIF